MSINQLTEHSLELLSLIGDNFTCKTATSLESLCHSSNLYLVIIREDILPVTWDFQQCGMCAQQRLRPACAYPQSDQSLW